MKEVTLMQILQAREDRSLLQKQLLQEYGCPVISFTMNIPGPIKISPLIKRAFRTGLSFLEKQLAAHLETPAQVLHRDIQTPVTGCQALFSVQLDAKTLKKICIGIEEATPLGRLFDMDVFDVDGSLLHRDPALADTRGCMVCGAPGRTCAAGRLHSVPQLQEATSRILFTFFAAQDARQIAALAQQSLIDEVHTTPKPGLVDRRNNGSHQDMNPDTFLASAHALTPYFEECVTIGQSTAQLSHADTFAALRRAGLAAEQTMNEATKGVNTHKGIIFTLGILCGALGRLWDPESPIAHTDALLGECASIAQIPFQSDFTNPGTTAGLRLFQSRGITGVRGEAATGLPSVTRISLPAYQNAKKQGLSSNHAGVIALLHLIASVTDTNLYHRGGSEGAAFAAQSAQQLLRRSPFPSLAEVELLDDAFIARNLSPGGCADLLAVTYFLSYLEQQLL